MNIEQVEKEIQGIYHFYADNAPGVTPVETGHLAELWALAVQLSPDEYPDG